LQKGWWGVKIDLKNAYFHLGVSPQLKKYLNINVGEDVYACDAACFGLGHLPFLWTKTMKVLVRVWRIKGLLVFVYLDDILIINPCKVLLQHQVDMVVSMLLDVGLAINYKKSILTPVQELEHLGLIIDFERGELRVPDYKKKAYRKELGKIVTKSHMSVRKVAAILGKVRSLLPALPSLRGFTDLLLGFVKNHQGEGWDSVHPLPLGLKTEVTIVSSLVREWPGRRFLSPSPPNRHLASDSADYGWGGVDITEKRVVHDFWFHRHALHINRKELDAAIATTMAFARPGETVLLKVDNATAYWYLKKEGGRLPHFNSVLRPFLSWAKEHRVSIVPVLVPSAEMEADEVSRWEASPGDVALSPVIFQKILHVFHEGRWNPEVDMFASPQNTLLPQFCARYPHHRAMLVDALACPLGNLKVVFAHPPWSLIQPWLVRLRDNPHILSMTLVPMWDSTWWWPLLLKLRAPHSPCVRLKKRWGLLTDTRGMSMPPPRVPLICVILSGTYFNQKASPPIKWVDI
jgi:hypothetical protein